MPKKEIWVFGNPDLKNDSLPFKILPSLKKHFPDTDFVIKDPNEEWDLPKNLTIIDTVHGLEKITVFTSLDQFANVPRLSMHDFDLLTNLRWLDKINKLPPFTIIGLPPNMSQKKSAQAVIKLLEQTISPT
jgi:ADP-heptose:LPS heptosyltransferase